MIWPFTISIYSRTSWTDNSNNQEVDPSYLHILRSSSQRVREKLGRFPKR